MNIIIPHNITLCIFPKELILTLPIRKRIAIENSTEKIIKYIVYLLSILIGIALFGVIYGLYINIYPKSLAVYQCGKLK